jgi:hypothetical protein
MRLNSPDNVCRTYVNVFNIAIVSRCVPQGVSDDELAATCIMFMLATRLFLLSQLATNLLRFDRVALHSRWNLLERDMTQIVFPNK